MCKCFEVWSFWFQSSHIQDVHALFRSFARTQWVRVLPGTNPRKLSVRLTSWAGCETRRSPSTMCICSIGKLSSHLNNDHQLLGQSAEKGLIPLHVFVIEPDSDCSPSDVHSSDLPGAVGLQPRCAVAHCHVLEGGQRHTECLPLGSRLSVVCKRINGVSFDQNGSLRAYRKLLS